MAEEFEEQCAADGNTAVRALIAYRVQPGAGPPIVPAPAARAWMDATDARFANRCLPLLLANQAGWLILGAHDLRVTWGGGDAIEDMRIEYLAGPPDRPASSHFGSGILTWNLPYLFRTPPGYNLLVRGPANRPKDGVSPLEGLVETDWAVATFTMNWQITSAHLAITFAAGEPICMIVPQRRGELESFEPLLDDLASAPDLSRGYAAWSASRAAFNRQLRNATAPTVREKWQRHYFNGTAPGGPAAPEHQRKLRLRNFREAGQVEQRNLTPHPAADDNPVADG